MIGYIILAAVILLIAVVLIRTAAFKPATQTEKTFEEAVFDRDAAV